jgi:hypothetical protein
MVKAAVMSIALTVFQLEVGVVIAAGKIYLSRRHAD